MSSDIGDEVIRQYSSVDPLAVRMQTHRLYAEQQVDLDEICYGKLLPAWRPTGDETLLDAGCGPGRFLAYLRDYGYQGRLVGLDQSTAMVTAVESLGVDAVHGDVQALPFDDETFDCLVARHMLYHVPDIGLALSEMRRVLKPGGRLLVTTNSTRSMPHITRLIQDLLAAFDYPEWERTDNRFSIENAAGFFDAAGLQVEEQIVENTLVFRDPEPPVAYCISSLPSLDISHDPQHLAELEHWLREEATQRLAAMEGEWRDPTFAGVYAGKRE